MSALVDLPGSGSADQLVYFGLAQICGNTCIQVLTDIWWGAQNPINISPSNPIGLKFFFIVLVIHSYIVPAFLTPIFSSKYWK